MKGNKPDSSKMPRLGSGDPIDQTGQNEEGNKTPLERDKSKHRRKKFKGDDKSLKKLQASDVGGLRDASEAKIPETRGDAQTDGWTSKETKKVEDTCVYRVRKGKSTEVSTNQCDEKSLPEMEKDNGGCEIGSPVVENVLRNFKQGEECEDEECKEGGDIKKISNNKKKKENKRVPYSSAFVYEFKKKIKPGLSTISNHQEKGEVKVEGSLKGEIPASRKLQTNTTNFNMFITPGIGEKDTDEAGQKAKIEKKSKTIIKFSKRNKKEKEKQKRFEQIKNVPKFETESQKNTDFSIFQTEPPKTDDTSQIQGGYITEEIKAAKNSNDGVETETKGPEEDVTSDDEKATDDIRINETELNERKRKNPCEENGKDIQKQSKFPECVLETKGICSYVANLKMEDKPDFIRFNNKSEMNWQPDSPDVGSLDVNNLVTSKKQELSQKTDLETETEGISEDIVSTLSQEELTEIIELDPPKEPDCSKSEQLPAAGKMAWGSPKAASKNSEVETPVLLKKNDLQNCQSVGMGTVISFVASPPTILKEDSRHEVTIKPETISSNVSEKSFTFEYSKPNMTDLYQPNEHENIMNKIKEQKELPKSMKSSSVSFRSQHTKSLNEEDNEDEQEKVQAEEPDVVKVIQKLDSEATEINYENKKSKDRFHLSGLKKEHSFFTWLPHRFKSKNLKESLNFAKEKKTDTLTKSKSGKISYKPSTEEMKRMYGTTHP